MSTCEFPNCSVTFSEFVAGPRIGSGSQGHVHEVYDQNGSRFCLKKLVSSPAAFAAESLAYMKKVSSPFVVPIYHAFKTEDFDNLIMELCEGGSLQQFIHNNSLSPEDVWLVLTQLVHALHDLHSAGIVHRDIKPSNVLLLSKERPLRVKVCDFGVCRDLDGPTIKTSYGTERFMAPEMFLARSHGSPVDIWALGVLIYFLVEKNYPFTTLPQLFTEEAPVSNSEFGELISSLLQKDPSKRPTAFQLLEHPKIIEYSQDFLAPCNLNDLYLLRRRIRMLENSTVKFQEFNNGINALKQEHSKEIQELNQKFSNFESRINERFDSEIANIKSKHDAGVACLYQKLTTIESKLSSTEAQLEQVTKNYQDQISSLTQSHKDSINTITRQHVLDTEKLNKEVARLSQLVVKLQGGISSLEISNQEFRDENVAFKNGMKNSMMSPQKVVELFEEGQRIREIEELRRSLKGNMYLMEKVPKLNGEPDWDKLGEVKEIKIAGSLFSMHELNELEGIQLFTGLEILLLSSTEVSDISPLSACTQLTYLNLQNAQVSDISPLSACTQLTELYLYNTQVSDISPLSACTQLTYLDLENTKVSDISPLSACTQLTKLDLENTKVSDISPLSACTQLTKLDLYNTQVSDISPLSACTQLTKLDLYNTQVSDISPLSACTLLTELNLRNTQVSDISPLSACTQLTYLDLQNTQVSDTSSLENMENLYICT
ncbi:hypothetical protein RCL1_007918 [Eukaryota sp. TZLM3-RCL]